MNSIQFFEKLPFIAAVRQLFKELDVPVNYIDDKPAKPGSVLGSAFNPANNAHALVEDVYVIGMIDDSAFGNQNSLFEKNLDIHSIGTDYEGLLLFGVELKQKRDSILPSRAQLAEITRAFNKVFPYTPVTIVFKYNNLIALANCERMAYKQQWREGEKLGKVSILKDVSITKPHAGHIRIIHSLSVKAIKEYDRNNKVHSFSDLYKGWLNVFRTDVLNKTFYTEYQELSVNLIRGIYPGIIPNKMSAHQGVLNFLNRIMFVYFVQKKGWLMKDDNFILHYWQDYQNTGHKNKFHDHWLGTLFFKAFNNRFAEAHASMKFLPDKYLEAFSEFPYLNGGLFHYYKEYDEFTLSDDWFVDIFKFFESYIFTISEDTPQEISLDINPELLGKMYEGMINATDLDDVDAEHGIIYRATRDKLYV